MTDKKCIDDSKVDPNIIIISDDQDNQHEIEELELMWGIKGGPRKLTMQDYHASIHETYAEESLDNINQESRGEIIADLSDEEYLFCLKLNDFKIEYTENDGRRILEMWARKIPRFSKTLVGEFEPNIANKRDTTNKDCISLFKDFVRRHELLYKDPNDVLRRYNLIFCKEYLEFVRKPGRIRTCKIGCRAQATMFCVDQIFLGEGMTVAEAVKSCVRVAYRLWLSRRNMTIKSIQKFFKKPPFEDGNLRVKLLDTPEMFESVREELMRSKYLLVDMEGDQLGPNGKITLLQINNYTSGNCYLLDILAVGDSSLRERDPQIGWLRDIFQYPRVIKFFWGGVSDTANLFASYEISVAGFIDLQVVESQYRQRLIKLTNGQQDPTKKHPLGLEAAYEYFTDKSLIRYKQGKAKHKTDYHVWSRRPLTSQLLKYAAFDVAALRPIVHVFVNNLELWRWGAWLGVISKSGMTTYPRHRTCYHCLITLSIDSFSKTQQKAYGLCKVCTEENQLLEAEAEEDEVKLYEQLPKRKSENRGNFPELGDLELPKYNILAVSTNPKMKFYPSETVLQRLGFTPKNY